MFTLSDNNLLSDKKLSVPRPPILSANEAAWLSAYFHITSPHPPAAIYTTISAIRSASAGRLTWLVFVHAAAMKHRIPKDIATDEEKLIQEIQAQVTCR